MQREAINEGRQRNGERGGKGGKGGRGKSWTGIEAGYEKG
jgi:hypothetical protein